MTYHPWREARKLHVEIARCRLSTRGAWWIPSERMILLDNRLTAEERRCAVAHELEHIRRGDTGCDWPTSTKQENAVAAAAARRLIPVEALAEADFFDRHPADIATDLGVDLPTLRVRSDSLTEDEREIVNSRMAAREWGAA